MTKQPNVHLCSTNMACYHIDNQLQDNLPRIVTEGLIGVPYIQMTEDVADMPNKDTLLSQQSNLPTPDLCTRQFIPYNWE